MLDFAIFAVTFLTVLLIAIVWLYPSSKKVTTIPGLDPSTKEDGNLSDITRAGSLHEFLLETHDKYGPIIGFWWGQTYVVSIASPELFKQHSTVFDRPVELFRTYEPLMGASSLQFANGTDGRSRRQFYDRAFSHEKFHLYLDKFQQIADAVKKDWLDKTDEDHVPLSEQMFNFAIKSAVRVLLGESFTDQKLVLSVSNAYEKAWSEMEHSLFNTTKLDDSGAKIKPFHEAVNYLQTTIKKVIKHRQEHNMKKQEFLLIDDVMEHSASEDIIVCDVLTYMVGAFHTTANTLTWCFYFLATHRDVQDKVYQEIQRILGGKGCITGDNIQKFSYISQVLDETMRCAVVAPWAARFQDFDSELGGHRIPKGTPVIHALGVSLQDETLWPIPNKFDPERFSPENSKVRGSYDFVPFGFAGKRKCPGYKFSYYEATVLIATLINRFEVSLWNDQVVQPVYGLVTHPHEEIWIKLTRRESAEDVSE